MLLSKPSHILLATCLLLSPTACSQDPDENPPGIITLVDQGSGGEDTDMNGPYGYDADISRSFVCDPDRATERQRSIYRIAYDHVQHN